MRISTIRPCALRTILVQPMADRKRRQRMRRLCLQPEGTATDAETLPARPPRRAARSRPTKPRRGPPAHHSAVLRPRGPSAARDASRYGKAYLPEDSGTSSDFAQTRPSPDPPPLHRRDLTRTSSTGAAPTAHPLADTRSARRRGPAARRPAGRFRLISGAVYRSVQPGVRTSCDRLEPQGVKIWAHHSIPRDAAQDSLCAVLILRPIATSALGGALQSPRLTRSWPLRGVVAGAAPHDRRSGRKQKRETTTGPLTPKT